MGRILLSITLIGITLFSQAQPYEQDKIPIGYHLQPGRVVTIYADHQGDPNPHQQTLLSGTYYFQIEGIEQYGCKESPINGVKFVQIWVPGSKDQNERNGVNVSAAAMAAKAAAKAALPRPEGGAPTIPGCASDFPKEALPVNLSGDQLGKRYWIAHKDLAENDALSTAIQDKDIDPEVFARAYRYSPFFSSFLAVPFKYRFSTDGSKLSAITAETSIGPCIGFKVRGSRYFDQNLVAFVSAGLTLLNPNTIYDDPAKAKPTQAGLYTCGGIGGNINRTQFGIVFGYDFAEKSWTYHSRPWLAFSIGFAFLNSNSTEKTGNR